MKPAITTITLLVANVLLLGYIFLLDGDSTEEREIETSWLAKFEPEQAARMVLSTSAGEAEVVKQEDGSWRILAPFDDRFDPRLMTELLADAKGIKIEDTISPKEIKKEGWDDKYFGFDQGAVKVQFFDAEGAELAGMELGGPTPFERTIYARRLGDSSDQSVHYVWGDLADSVGLPFDQLRDPRLVYTKVDDVFRVKFRPPPAGALEVQCDKGRDGSWRMLNPIKTRCDQELVKELIGKLAKLEVAEIVDQPDADVESAFEEQDYTIVLRQRTPTADNAKLTVEFGRLPTDEADPFVLARVSDREGVVFKVDKRVHYEFGMDGNDLRARTLGDFDYNAVAGVTIKRAGVEEDIKLQRYGAVWALQQDAADPNNIESANGRMVKDLLEDINSEEILEFASDAPVDLEPYGLAEAPIEVTIRSWYVDPEAEVKEGEEPQVLGADEDSDVGPWLHQPAGGAGVCQI